MYGDLRAVIYDFDGVILESTAVKTDAFARLYADSPHSERFLQFHLDNMGVSRYDKIRFYYEELLGRTATEEEIADDADRFSELVFSGVMESEFVTGALACLEQCSRRLRQFVASATPEEELNRLAVRRDVARYFERLFGAPMAKTEAIYKVKAEYRLGSNEILFVGDAMSDYAAAAEAGVFFVGRRSPGGPGFSGLDCPVVDDLTGLMALLS